MNRDIAIIGMACRYPGGPSPEELWETILQKGTGFVELKDQRWQHQDFFDSNPRARNKTYGRRAALLPSIASFGARHFRIPPRRARQMDPQQRLLLELTREALQDAGLENRPFQRTRSGVFMGINLSEYGGLLGTNHRIRQLVGGQFGEPLPEESARMGEALTDTNAYTLSGSNVSMCASNLAQFFDLRGPAITVDAACSASSAAIISAVQHLRSLPPSKKGEAPIAITGGAYILLNPDNMIAFSKLGTLAPEECRPFDAGASGFLLGEGAGVLVLRRLKDAVAAGDRIYAVIKGAAWNNDGQSRRPTTPDPAGQEMVARLAFEDADLKPEQIQFIECHGTGTPVGDQVELQALANVWPDNRRPYIGSLKANLGHSLAASAVGGVIRAARAVYEGVIPPQANFTEWHPELEEIASRFRVPQEPVPWKSRKRRAAVNSYAFGGTNCFLVLEEYRPRQKSRAPRSSYLPCCCSAETPELLRQYLEQLMTSLDDADPDTLAAAAYTVSVTRKLGRYAALFVVNGSFEQPVRKVLQALDGAPEEWSALGPSEWVGPLPEKLKVNGEPVDPALKGVLEIGEPDPEAWSDLYPEWSRRVVSLPSTPIERDEFWFLKQPLDGRQLTAE